MKALLARRLDVNAKESVLGQTALMWAAAENHAEATQALIEAEAPTGDRHDQMVASFNRGYRGFQQSYRSCTPAAGVVIQRYLEEGAHIAREITARYAN